MRMRRRDDIAWRLWRVLGSKLKTLTRDPPVARTRNLKRNVLKIRRRLKRDERLIRRFRRRMRSDRRRISRKRRRASKKVTGLLNAFRSLFAWPTLETYAGHE